MDDAVRLAPRRPTLCRQLAHARTDVDRERAALALNVAAVPSLGSKHFTHGARVLLSVDETLRLSARSSDPVLVRAIHDANRAFTGGIDHAVLDDWITTPVCGRPATGAVQGLASARCVELDEDCRRGRFDAARGCCSETDMPPGMVCGEDGLEVFGGDASADRADDGGDSDHHDRDHADSEHHPSEHADRDHHDGAHGDGHHDRDAANVCDGRGACVPSSEVPRSSRASGEWLWLEPVQLDSDPPVPSIWHLDDGRVEVRADGVPVAIIPPSQVGHRTRVSSSPPDALGVVGLDMSTAAPSVVRSIILPRRIWLNTDLAHGETYEVCAATGRFDGYVTLVGECLGDQRVTCPSAAGAAITCTVDPRGFSVVTGAGLGLAWERDPPPTIGFCFNNICPDTGPPCGGNFPPCPDAGPAGDAAPPAIDAGTDAGGVILPAFTDLRDPAPLARFAIFLPLGLPLVPLDDDLSTAVPFCHGHGCEPPIGLPPGFGQGGFGGCADPAGCTTSCGSEGVGVCFNGIYGGCFPPVIDFCNGLDDDCDGRVDEGASAFGGDNIACTIDSCSTDTTLHTGHCVHDGGPGFRGGMGRFGPLCQPAIPRSPTCVQGFCGVSPAFVAEVAATVDPRDSFAPPNTNGCAFITENSFCQDTFFRGGCGGVRERCAPGVLGSDAASGCQDYCNPIVTPRPAIDTLAISGECSGTFSPGPSGSPGGVIIAHNAYNGDSILGWTFSPAAGPPAWSSCNAETLPGPGSTCAGPIPRLATDTAPGWKGDPVVAADGRGNVVLVSLDNGGALRNLDVVASISTDGGRTFGRTIVVNDFPNQAECSRAGGEDQPAVTFDLDVDPPHLWIVWRHAQPRFPIPTALAAFGGCIRGGTLDTSGATPSINWFSASQRRIRNMVSEDSESGQGGLRVVARMGSFGGPRTERVAVMYSTTGHLFNDCSDRRVRWQVVSSDVDVTNWFGPVQVAQGDSFHWCIPGVALAPGGSPILRGFREFDFALDRSTGAFWAVVTNNNTVSVFISPDDSSWQHVTDVVNSPGSAWLPAIGVDADGRVAVTYYAVDGTGRIHRMLVASAAGAANLAAPWSRPVALSGGFLGSGAESRAQSDYQTTLPSRAGPSASTRRSSPPGRSGCRRRCPTPSITS